MFFKESKNVPEPQEQADTMAGGIEFSDGGEAKFPEEGSENPAKYKMDVSEDLMEEAKNEVSKTFAPGDPGYDEAIEKYLRENAD